VSALAPAVAALSGMGLVLIWRSRVLFAATIAGTAWLAVDLLDRTADFAPWLRVAIPVAAVAAVASIAAVRAGGRKFVAVAAITGAFALGAAPASYAIANVGHSLNGNNVLAGPSSVSSGGFGGGGGGMRGGTPPGGGGSAPSGTRPSGGTTPSGSSTTRPSGGGMGSGASVDATLISYLEQNQGSAKYLVAVSGAQSSAPIILQTGKAVVTIGGFTGSDNAPTVSQLAEMVKNGELKYVLLSDNSGGGPGGNSSSAISTWVKAHGTAVTSVTTSSGTLYAVSAS